MIGFELSLLVYQIENKILTAGRKCSVSILALLCGPAFPGQRRRHAGRKAQPSEGGDLRGESRLSTSWSWRLVLAFRVMNK